MNHHITAILRAREASPFSDSALTSCVHSAIDAGEDIGYCLAVALARTPSSSEIDAAVHNHRERKTVRD
jgi:hypothetical protein